MYNVISAVLFQGLPATSLEGSKQLVSNPQRRQGQNKRGRSISSWHELHRLSIEN